MTDQLVETIVRQDFGVKFADVTNILLKNPNVTLLELKSLCKEANISFDMLRHILIILYKHNLVTIRSKSTDSGTADQNGDKDKIYYYSLSIPDIIHRTSHPKILQFIKKRHGELSEAIVLNFIENGRLTLSECAYMILESGDKYDEKEIHKAIVSLIRANYLQRIESPDSVANQMQEEPEKVQESTKKRTKKKNTISASELEIIQGKSTKKSESSANMLKKSATAEKSKKKEVKMAEEKEESKTNTKDHSGDKDRNLFVDAESGEEFIFSLNFRQYLHDFRANMITELVSQKFHNQRAAAIMHAIMSESKLLSKAEKFKITEPLSGIEINSKLNLLATIKENETERSLDLLLKEGLLKKSTDFKDGSQIGYSVNMELIVKMLKGILLGKIIESKFTSYHARIFRVLEKKGYLTPKQVSEFCMIPVNDARSYLFQLFKAKLVDSKEIQLESEKEMNYIFGAKLEATYATIIEEMRKTIHNLKVRQELETQAFESQVNLTKDMKAKKVELISKLESAVLATDSDVLLLAEF